MADEEKGGGQKKRGQKKFVFQRPPYANELFTDEYRKIFDSHPAYSRHFIKQYLLTGNLQTAAKQANLGKELAIAEKHIGKAKDLEVRDLLSSHGLGPGDLVMYLLDCVKAEGLIRDKHGVMHKTVDLKVRLEALRLIFQMTGQLERERVESRPALVEELFKNLEIDEEKGDVSGAV